MESKDTKQGARATVGILGGMGPEATVSFFGELVRRTPATRDQDHLKVVVLNDPTIPDRTAFLMGGGKSPLPKLIAGVKALQDQGADMIAIPCNTAHYFLEEMRAAVQIPILDIVQETIRALHQKAPGEKTVGILSTAATARMDLYGSALDKAGYRVCLPDATHQARVTQAIQLIKSSADPDSARALQEETLRHLQSQGAGVAILACTELGLVEIDSPVPLVDSLKALAAATVAQATQRASRALRRTRSGKS